MFNSLTDYPEFFSTMLNVAGVLLGLAFSTLLFILAGGFKEFPSSRRMLLKFYVTLGTNLLMSLSWIVLACFGGLYLNISSTSFELTVFVVNLFWLKTLLDYKSHQGYIHTLGSNKSCPASYGKFRSYLRYIENLGRVSLIVLGIELWFLIIFPIIEARDMDSGARLEHWLYVSTSVHLFYSLARIVAFIPQFFHITKKEYESADILGSIAGEKESRSNIDYVKEHKVFRLHLQQHGFRELDSIDRKNFLDGTIFINYRSEDKREVWMNINIECSLVDLKVLLIETLKYGRNLLDTFSLSGCDLQEIVLSFSFDVEGMPYSNMLFFRAERKELESAGFVNSDYHALMNLKNKVVDPMWKGHLEG